MDHALPVALTQKLEELDAFIEREIVPLEAGHAGCTALVQVHGGPGYSRRQPFEHIYRHHRRYRITEGPEEVQMGKVAGYLFSFAGPNRCAERSRSAR